MHGQSIPTVSQTYCFFCAVQYYLQVCGFIKNLLHIEDGFLLARYVRIQICLFIDNIMIIKALQAAVPRQEKRRIRRHPWSTILIVKLMNGYE